LLFGNRLRQIGKIRQMTQEKLGEKAGVSYKYIGEIERGEVNPSLDILVRLTQVLEVPPNELFVFKNPPKSKKFDFSSLTPADIKSIKNTLNILKRRVFFDKNDKAIFSQNSL